MTDLLQLWQRVNGKAVCLVVYVNVWVSEAIIPL